MDNKQYSTIIDALVRLIDRLAPKATTAAEVEALAAVAQALATLSKV